MASRAFPCSLMLLVAFAHTRCVAAHGAELVRYVQTQAAEQTPLEETAPCENESGCICKGATLAGAADVPVDDARAWDFGQILEAFRSLALTSEAPSGSRAAPRDRLRGEGARGWLQVLRL